MAIRKSSDEKDNMNTAFCLNGAQEQPKLFHGGMVGNLCAYWEMIDLSKSAQWKVKSQDQYRWKNEQKDNQNQMCLMTARKLFAGPGGPGACIKSLQLWQHA